ncbi:hypothetical protein OD997_03895 [Microbacterium sp. CGR1]
MGGQHSTDVVNSVMDGEIIDRIPIPAPREARERLGFEDTVAWLRDDTKTQSPVSLLGRVYYKFEGDEELRSHAYSMELEIDPESVLKKPVTRQELLVNHETAAEAGFLSFVSAKVGATEMLEMRVVDNAAASARVVGTQWMGELDKWFARQKKQPIAGGGESCSSAQSSPASSRSTSPRSDSVNSKRRARAGDTASTWADGCT